MTTWADDAAAALDDLGDSPTPVQARAVTDRYPNVDVLAALASRGGGGGGGVLTAASATLTNAQILALPTTPVQIVAAPGANNLLVVHSAVIVLDATAGAYTDFDGLQVLLNYGSASLKNASSTYIEAANGAFEDDNTINLLGVFSGTLLGGYVATWFGDTTNVVDTALYLFASNGAAGDLDGGNAANTLTVHVTYQTVTL